MQPLHTSVQPLHTFLLTRTDLRTFGRNFIKLMKKKESDKLKSLARNLFINGAPMVEIADKLNVSRATISRWKEAESWQEARAAKNITRPELVNKLLLSIDNLIQQCQEKEDPLLLGSLADKLYKFASAIEKLDKKANVVDTIEVFMAFSRWMEYRAQTDPEITPELLKTFNKYQDLYIAESIGLKS